MAAPTMETIHVFSNVLIHLTVPNWLSSTPKRSALSFFGTISVGAVHSVPDVSKTHILISYQSSFSQTHGPQVLDYLRLRIVKAVYSNLYALQVPIAHFFKHCHRIYELVTACIEFQVYINFVSPNLHLSFPAFTSLSPFMAQSICECPSSTIVCAQHLQ